MAPSIMLLKGALFSQVVYERFEGNHRRFEKGFSSTLERFGKTAQVLLRKDDALTALLTYLSKLV